VLEGFPRRIGQAEALDRHLAARGTALDAACYLEVPDEELRRRLGSRGRVDDDERVIGHRLAVFRTQTRPLLAYYQDRGRLVVIACQPAASSPGSACIGDHDRAEFISWSRARPQAAL
jgi:adenylate kinase